MFKLLGVLIILNALHALILRVCGCVTTIQYNERLESLVIPGVGDIVAAVHGVMG